MLVGLVALDGTAQITFDNFTPDQLDTFQLIDLTNGTASSWFSNVEAPEGWMLSNDGLLVIPEPATLPAPGPRHAAGVAEAVRHSSLGSEFGLTPRSRARLDLQEPQQDPAEALRALLENDDGQAGVGNARGR